MRTDQASNGRVSVVIPAFNAAEFLGETLQSVVNQSQRPHEIIVVDDGSTDDTPAIARSFGAIVISVANAGVSAARNTGVKAATGEYIAYLDADDVWIPEKLALQAAALASYRFPAFSFTDYRLFDESGVWRKKSELRAHWAFRRVAGKPNGQAQLVIEARGKNPVLYDSYIPPSSVLVRRADVLAVGGFDESLRVTEDYEFYLRLLKRLPAVVVMKPLLLYRRHAGQVTAKGPAMKAGFFAVAQRVAASPASYPTGDMRYIARTGYLRHYVLGMEQARNGEFDEAIASFGLSLRARWSVPAWLALGGATFCRSRLGRSAFQLVRGLWKRRPGRR